jgi:Zn-dependent protease
MNYDLLFLVIFYLILLIIFKVFRNKFEIQYKVFALYKTQWGIKLMDKIAKKFPNLLYFIGYVSVFIGFVGMIVTLGFIFYATYKFLFVPNAEAALAPLLPGIVVNESLPVLSFWHWILAILIVAAIHEFSHGVFARLSNIKIKSSGFAFIGPLLAAFVEPDEKQMKKKSIKEQLFVYSAGPFSNIILGIVAFFALFLIFVPLTQSMTEITGLQIMQIDSNLPINKSGLTNGLIIEEIDGLKINNVDSVTNALAEKKAGDVVKVIANNSSYDVILSQHPKDSRKVMLGITMSGLNVELKESLQNYSWLYKTLQWLSLLVFWIVNISIGVGLFNLLPLGPVDGGRMFHAAMIGITKNEKKAIRILSVISFIIFAMILINMSPFFIKLFKFILSPILG